MLDSVGHNVKIWLTTGASVMSVKGKKVLHIDRNDHYGGFVTLAIPLPNSADAI